MQFRDFKKLHKLPLKRSLDKSSINNYILLRMKDMHIIRDFIAPNRESFLTTACAKSYYKNIK
ncbi:hypothetical protein EC600_00500 [Helicobacter pylori]|nr:hypothetical protein EC600_00500 [Helicobacter pylori]